MGKWFRALAAAGSAAALAGGLLATTAGSVAAYGNSAVYQIELTANVGGHQGGGVWLWIELDANGTGDYTGADCGHGSGSVSDRGDVTWSASNGWITVNGVVLNGLSWPTTVTVPATYGHYSGTLGTFLTLPPFIPGFLGTSQLQVAP